MDATGVEYYRLFAGFRGLVQRRPRLRVYATREEYLAAILKVAPPEFSATSGLFFTGDETVYCYEKPDVEFVLKHECFHQFAFYVIQGSLPMWVNEGLAEYFSEGTFDQKTGTLQLGATPRERLMLLKAARDAHSMMTIEHLLKIDGRGWAHNLGTEKAPLEYTQAWSLCHFLIHADGGKYEPYFGQFLHQMDQGLDSDTAFKRVFGVDILPLQTKYDEYVDQLIQNMPAVATKPQPAKPQSATKAKKSP